MGAQSGVNLSAPVSDAELWPCDSCGVRGLTTSRDLYVSGTSGLRIPLMTMRVCPRCYQLHPHVAVCAALYLLKYERLMPQLEDWLAKQSEPTFDLEQHVLRNRGLLPKTEPQPEPYTAKKIIVPVGA